ncbi:hypothetical protein BDP27DRAFT_1404698 [Rhodocollybia butyracea]|uniref:Uncharacterized protein n=1 Tax=Rhodocollybia butyracea TaxID=206335 RepID=A0A9P5PPU7_9AGAR|nr:hypothetical protein BDP27DRAFT_1404698 [Rhodocollybia butyracea]
MASLRAYHLPADSTSATDESQSVSVERLNAVGWKITSVPGGKDEIEQAAHKLAEELGFPVSKEGCKVPFHLDLEKHGATLEPEMVGLVSQAAEVQNSHISLSNEAFIALTGGTLSLDVEDVTTAVWIRFHLVTGMILRVPTGGRYRIDFHEQNRGATGIAYFKETISNHGLLVKDEIDNHPARHAYLSTRQT